MQWVLVCNPMTAVINDSRRTYQRWVEDHAQELYRFAYRTCGRADLAEDLVQETFYHAWRGQSTLKDQAKARAWLFQILRYRYAHWARTTARRPRTGPIDERLTETPEDQTRSPLDRLAESEALQRALDELDERFRTVFLLVFSQGLSCQEAADELGIPLGTVLSRIHRARKILRGTLAEYDPDLQTDENHDNNSPRFKLGG